MSERVLRAVRELIGGDPMRADLTFPAEPWAAGLCDAAILVNSSADRAEH
ncbi:hypothetical protein [Streptomyces sp. NPDC019224]